MKTILVVVAVVTAICTAVVLGLLVFAVGVLAAVMPYPGTVDGLPAPPPAVGQMVVVPAQLLPGTPANGYPDAFPFGQCTYWVALCRRETHGFPFAHPFLLHRGRLARMAEPRGLGNL